MLAEGLLIEGGGSCNPHIRTIADFQAFTRSGFSTARVWRKRGDQVELDDLPIKRWHTVAQFLEYAHAKRMPAWAIEQIVEAWSQRIIGAITPGRKLGQSGTPGTLQFQGALESAGFTSTSATTWNIPDAVGTLLDYGWGAGGGGGSGGSNGTQASGGGGGGGALDKIGIITPGGATQQITVTCGTGGTAGAAATGAAGNNGGPGGDTTISGGTFNCTHEGASGGGGGSISASGVAYGGMATKNGANVNQYAGLGSTALPGPNGTGTTAFVSSPSGGGFAAVATAGVAGGRGSSSLASTAFAGGAGGTSTSAGGGGGGGAGPTAAGGAGGNGVASTGGTTGASPAANTGAGAGGGGGTLTAADPSFAGGVGGSGEANLYW